MTQVTPRSAAISIVSGVVSHLGDALEDTPRVTWGPWGIDYAFFGDEIRLLYCAGPGMVGAMSGAYGAVADPQNRLAVFGIISAILSSLAFLPYILNICRRRTHPVRSSWLIWSVLSVIAFSGQIYEGAGASLWFAGIQSGGTTLVFVLSIVLGAGRYLKPPEYLVLVAAACGIGLWHLTDTAVYALAISISISLLGGIPTVVGAYLAPEKETMSMWMVSLIASIFAIWSVGSVDWVLLAYPLYLFTLYGAVVVAMVLGRARQDVERMV